MPKRKPKPIRASTKKKGKAKKAGLLKVLHHSLHEENLGLIARQGAGHIGMMMMLRAKRLRKWFLWLKRRRLALKKRLRNLAALERLLHEEMQWTQECQTAFRLITDPGNQEKSSKNPEPESDLESQTELESENELLNEEQMNALLASFPRLKTPILDTPHHSSSEGGPKYRAQGRRFDP